MSVKIKWQTYRAADLTIALSYIGMVPTAVRYISWNSHSSEIHLSPDYFYSTDVNMYTSLLYTCFRAGRSLNPIYGGPIRLRIATNKNDASTKRK